MAPKFYTQNGNLTAYALACGYVEIKNNFRLSLDGVYHVQNGEQGYWESFNTLRQARANFNEVAN